MYYNRIKRVRETQTHTQTQTDTDRHTHTHTHTQRERERERETCLESLEFFKSVVSVMVVLTICQRETLVS